MSNGTDAHDPSVRFADTSPASLGRNRFAMLLCLGVILLGTIALPGCREDDPPPPEVRPVRAIVVARQAVGEPVSLTGQIQAQTEVALAFRIDGRLLKRGPGVGATLKAGELVATLESHNEQNALRAARASLASALAALTQSRNALDRQETLLKGGFTTRANYDQAQQAYVTARAQVEAAEAEQQVAQDRLDDTELRADAPGIVTEVGAEPGEIVRAGQAILRAARKEGRDAVFDAPSSALLRAATHDPVIVVRLADDPSVTAQGRVREVAAQADPTTRTFRIRVGLSDPPSAMRLGATAVGQMHAGEAEVIRVPATALIESDGQPAVWLVDPKTQTVAQRVIGVANFGTSTAEVAHGLSQGDIVVTAGVHALRPGQKVRVPGLVPP
jgi:RND family efflux transporter MFP subunit